MGESKEERMRIDVAQKLEEARLAREQIEKQLALKVQEFKQLSSTLQESFRQKGENILLKQQITKVDLEVKRLQSELLYKSEEAETAKKKIETAAREGTLNTKAMVTGLNQSNLKKTKEIEYLSNQISQKDKDYEIHTQQLKDLDKTNLMFSKVLEEARNNLAASEAKNKVLEVKVDQSKVESSILFKELDKTQQHLGQIEGIVQVLKTDNEHLKNRNTFLV